MHLSPQEKDKLLIVTAALLAERRLQRGLRLNHPEAVAWLSFLVLEGARDGKSVAELMQEGTTWLSRWGLAKPLLWSRFAGDCGITCSWRWSPMTSTPRKMLSF